MAKKILIIDDEQKIVEICGDYLKAAFFDVISAMKAEPGSPFFTASTPI